MSVQQEQIIAIIMQYVPILLVVSRVLAGLVTVVTVLLAIV